MLAVTSLYAGLLALMLCALSLHVIRGRHAHKVGLADGGEQGMLRRIRAQGNFCEYVPMILLLMVLAELQGTTPVLLHLLGALAVVGRGLHAYALLHAEPNGKGFGLRVAGMGLTFSSLILGALCVLYIALSTPA